MTRPAYTLYTGYLNSTDDLEDMVANFSLIGKVIDTSSQRNLDSINRQLWYALTGSTTHGKYILKTRMPFLVRAAFKSGKSMPSLYCIKLPDDDLKTLEIPLTKDAVVLLSATLCLQIKENKDDIVPKRPKEALWVPPRDFQLLLDQSVTPLPKCYVEIFLSDLQFVKELKLNPEPKPTLFDYVLSGSPTIRQAWDGFKETFMEEKQ